MAGGLVRAYVNTPKHLKHLGSQFYPMWHADAEHFAQHIGGSIEQGASILAHLSPSQESEMNRLMAYQMVHGMSDKQGDLLVKAAGHAQEAKGIRSQMMHMSKRGEEGTSTFHKLSQQHEALRGEAKTLRQRSGIQGTPLGQQSSRSLGAAVQAMRGEIHPMESLGNVKIRDFGESIVNPHSSRFPIDTHFHDATLGRLDIPYATSRGLSAKGRYEDFLRVGQQGHRLTQQRLGEEMPITSWMGGIWYGHQQRKVQQSPAAHKARRAADTRLARMLASPGAQPFLPERFGLAPAFGKIAT